MNLPADIPSYLSSQGTLSEPQEGYSNSEAGSHQQLMPSLTNGYAHKVTDGKVSGSLQKRPLIDFLCTEYMSECDIVHLSMTAHNFDKQHFRQF